jgi:hypothetical protein
MKTNLRFRTARNGFTLVITISLLVLLTVICLGLLSLSAITLRGGSRDQARSMAQSNARLAMMIAIGELQKQLGPDQRITANGSILSTTQVVNPHWMGTWDSWRAGTSAPPTTLTNPDPSSDHRTLPIASNLGQGMAPTYVANRRDHFRSWLVSLHPNEASSIDSAINLSPSTLIELVGKGSLGNSANANDLVKARLIDVKGNASTGVNGRYGYWVGDESQKARILKDSYGQQQLTMAEKISRSQSAATTGTKRIKGLENITPQAEEKLNALPTLVTLDVLPSVTGRPSQNYHSTTPFSYSVIADVREGGLKRDLSTLLERTISLLEKGDEFMLYKFTTGKDTWSSSIPNQEAVPISDLAAYYQMYDGFRTNLDRGVKYSSNLMANGMQLISPNYGTVANTEAYFREYTAQYRQPAPVKIQFLLSLFSRQLVPGDLGYQAPNPNNPKIPTHELLMGITPSITLWNHTNLPLMMRFDKNPNLYAQMLRLGALPFQIRFSKNNNEFTSNYKNLSELRGSVDGNKPELMSLYFSGLREIRFEPGEVKTFSLPYSGDVSGIKNQLGLGGHWTQANNKANFFFKTDRFFPGHEVIQGWDPQSFLLFNQSAAGAVAHVVNNRLLFNKDDQISFDVNALNPQMGNADLTAGGAMSFIMIQTNHQDFSTPAWNRRHFAFNSRHGSAAANSPHNAFNQTLFTKGFPNGNAVISSAPRSGFSIISRTPSQEGWPFLQFSLQASVETNESSNGGLAAGRKFASRPFIHSSPLSPAFIDDHTGMSLYNTGWNWSASEINDVFEAPVQISAKNQGYFGGGYTPESGTTHIVQTEIPVVPPIAMAALSHARLGGFSLANDNALGSKYNQNITATGQGGLFPQTLQAIGNSYAHPQIPANQAFITWNRVFDSGNAAGSPVTLADHSYLANKALWDDFFFSSIAPEPSPIKVFEGSGRSASTVAYDFFFYGKPLANRRMQPYKANLDEAKLNQLFTQYDTFQNGLADKIAAHMMVEGGFNVNSTSVEAWKVFFSSLKGKPVAYLDTASAMTGKDPTLASGHTGTPVGSGALTNGKLYKGSSNDPSQPDQWQSWRELTDAEIDALATAMVKQVKLRGPFLSLSEFVNRRLDAANPELAAKGALQAALDDSSVPINEGFRSNKRKFSAAETASISAAFPLAASGPVAYGSPAYVDQADILRNFAEQLTPRGDTFVLRSYGESLDASGKVLARAWCEAVIQRTPEYIDARDEGHVRQVSLTQAANKAFGRKMKIVSFRWLHPSEV